MIDDTGCRILSEYIGRASGVLFFQLDGNAAVTRCNEAAARLLGLRTDGPMLSLQALGFKQIGSPAPGAQAAGEARPAAHYLLEGAGGATLAFSATIYEAGAGRFVFMERLGGADLQAVESLVDAEVSLASLTRELSRKNRQLSRANELINRLMTTDMFTGLLNRRTFFLQLKETAERSAASCSAFALAVSDLDSFKAFNDRYGHLIGDSIIASVADIIRKNLRKGDYAARLGGERFAMVFNADTVDRCMAICERVRGQVEMLSHEGSRLVTTSMGLTMYKVGDNEDSLMERADRALCFAKSIGKNRVVIDL